MHMFENVMLHMCLILKNCCPLAAARGFFGTARPKSGILILLTVEVLTLRPFREGPGKTGFYSLVVLPLWRHKTPPLWSPVEL